jgi:hypothetical protein
MELKQQCSSDQKIEVIKDIVQEVMKVNLLDRKRHARIVEARMIFSLMLRENGFTYKAIGRYLRRDHSTIMYYHIIIKDLMQVDMGIVKNYTKCKEQFLIKEDYLNLENNKEYLLSEVSMLRNKVKLLEMDNRCLISEKENLIKEFTFDNKNRLTKVFKFIDDNTPDGREHIIYRRIKKCFNG